jgi:hypothetical protein
MPFDKESAKKAGAVSSRKGIPNKANTDLRVLISHLVESNFEHILNDLNELEPKERVNAWIRLLEFCTPKISRVTNELTGAGGEPLETIIRFVDDSKDERYFDS